ncbi:MAG: hypothetical protein BVN33_03800 [Proteobacteria bacterium ST_bin13]|nr:MAG: hypothetical protein BVN33_03800 [Proteobacteria bacterium ST_bin13]
MLTSTTAGAGTMTSVSFVLITLGIIFAVAMILWGSMRRRVKKGEIAEAKRHAVVAGHSPTVIAPDAPIETPVAPAGPTTEPDSRPADAAVSDPVAATPTAESASGEPLPVTLLKGLGPKAAARLAALGITTIDQLAVLSPDEITALDAQMESFVGRIARDRWIEQARLLATGDKAGFEAAFGKLGG